MKIEQNKAVIHLEEFHLNIYQQKMIKGGSDTKKPNLQKVIDVRGMGK